MSEYRSQIPVNSNFSEEQFRGAILGLAKRTLDTFLETPPAALLAPPRGGLIVAAALSHAITGVVLDHQSRWDSKYDAERVYSPQVAAKRSYERVDAVHVKAWCALPVHSTDPLHPVLGSANPLPVLLVDDIYDTGETLCKTYKTLRELGRFKVLGVVTVHARPYREFPNMPEVQPLDIPHLYAVHLTSYDGWVNYFWEEYGK